MKHVFMIALITLAGTQLFAQDSTRFRNFHGILYEGNQYFEAEGYEIFIRKTEYGVDEKGLKKIAKQYDMKGAQRTDTVIRDKAIVLVRRMEVLRMQSYSICYLLPKDGHPTTVIGFSITGKRDVTLEHYLIHAYLEKSIPEYVYTSGPVDVINFIGRTIQLGASCRWMSPHNVQCPDYGQMSWAVFDNEPAALNHRDIYITSVKNRSMADILEDTWVTVKFEGIETKARRMKVKIKIPTFVMGGSNILIAYYVVANVRGKYVSCVLSQYTDDVNGKKLAPLLREVLELQE